MIKIQEHTVYKFRRKKNKLKGKYLTSWQVWLSQWKPWDHLIQPFQYGFLLARQALLCQSELTQWQIIMEMYSSCSQRTRDGELWVLPPEVWQGVFVQFYAPDPESLHLAMIFASLNKTFCRSGDVMPAANFAPVEAIETTCLSFCDNTCWTSGEHKSLWGECMNHSCCDSMKSVGSDLSHAQSHLFRYIYIYLAADCQDSGPSGQLTQASNEIWTVLRTNFLNKVGPDEKSKSFVRPLESLTHPGKLWVPKKCFENHHPLIVFLHCLGWSYFPHHELRHVQLGSAGARVVSGETVSFPCSYSWQCSGMLGQFVVIKRCIWGMDPKYGRIQNGSKSSGFRATECSSNCLLKILWFLVVLFCFSRGGRNAVWISVALSRLRCACTVCVFLQWHFVVCGQEQHTIQSDR